MFADWYFLNLSMPLYTLYIHLYTIVYCIPMYSDVFRCIPYTFVAFVFLVFNSTKFSWDLDICSTACQRDGEISSAAPSRFPQDMSVNQTSRPSSIILGWCGQSVSKEIEDVISAQKCTAGFGVADVASNLCAGEAIQFDTQHHKRSCQRSWQGPSTYSGECSNV